MNVPLGYQCACGYFTCTEKREKTVCPICRTPVTKEKYYQFPVEEVQEREKQMKAIELSPKRSICDYCGNLRETRIIKYTYPLLDCSETIHVCHLCTEHVPSFVHVKLDEYILRNLVLFDRVNDILYRFSDPTALRDRQIVGLEGSTYLLSPTTITVRFNVDTSPVALTGRKSIPVDGTLFAPSQFCYDEVPMKLLSHPSILFLMEPEWLDVICIKHQKWITGGNIIELMGGASEALLKRLKEKLKKITDNGGN